MKSITLSLLSLSALAIGLVLSGCTSYTLAGGWSGEIDCGSGAAEIDFEWDLEEDGQDAYKGDGTYSWTSDYYWEWGFDVEITHGSIGMGMTEVELDVELVDCVEIDTGEGECPNVEATWYLKEEVIEGEVQDWFSLDGSTIDCDFTLD